nr:hypothetical protein [Chloroflexota bacterium]
GQPYFPDACVDLIYLDLPFNSNRSCNVLFKDEHGRQGGGFAAGCDIATLKRAQRAASNDDAQPALIGGGEPEN